MGKEYRSELWDNMQNWMAAYNDHMVHMVINFNGELNMAAFKTAVERAVNLAPILKCKFQIKKTKPVWVELDDFKVDNIIELAEGAYDDDTVEKFLVQIIDERKGPQIRFKIFRNDKKDTLAILLNHMTFDGQAFKEWIEILAKLYTNILTDPNYDIKDYDNGDRSFDQLFKSFSTADKLKTSTMFTYGEKNIAKIGFPYARSRRFGLTPRIMKYKLPADRFLKIKAVGKRSNMTLNDIIMAVWARSVGDLIPAEKVPMEIDCILDLRRYLPEGRTAGLTNFVTKIVCAVDNDKSESIFSTIAQVNQNMEYAKKNYPGLGGLPQLRLGFKLLPNPIAEKVVRAAFNNPLVAISNIGILNDKNIQFGDLYINDCFMTGSIKKNPYIQLALTTFRNEITFTIALYANEADQETVKKCYSIMDNYFRTIEATAL